MTEDAAETLRRLKEATREAHEATQAAREERRRLEKLKGEIRNLVESATSKAIEVEISKGSEVIFMYQKVLEEEIVKRFDTLVNEPLHDLEKLIRDLHRAHATIPLAVLKKNPLPESPLFPKRPN